MKLLVKIAWAGGFAVMGVGMFAVFGAEPDFFMVGVAAFVGYLAGATS